ncbi:MAG: DUF4388 domain-containing protein [Deltaproteobacteria bacterium]|nr:DUF4388 domain-containing protein [Deltaproteobacteria bacterium]
MRRAVLLDVGASGPRAREGGALAASLSARGFTLERLDHDNEVIDALARENADVLVIDADSPSLDLRVLVESLRADPRTTNTLIVALASGDPREIPARRELALTLSKPIQADDAAGRIEALVITRLRAASNSRELRGDLSQISLPDLLQLLAVNRNSGVLSIDAPGRFGSVTLDAGEIQWITCGVATALKAFVRLLALTEGAFVFTHQPFDRTQSNVEPMALGPMLFEATRHIDEIARLKRSMPESWVEVRKARLVWPQAILQRFEREPALFEVTRLLDSARTLGTLLDASPLPDADLLEALDELRREGLIDIAGGARSGWVEVLDTALARTFSELVSEQGGARVLVLLDGEDAGAEMGLIRALGGVAGFVSAEGVGSPDGGPIAPLGTLAFASTRVELLRVFSSRENSPLWLVFGANASAVLCAVQTEQDAALTREVFARGSDLPVAVAVAPWTPSSIAAALRAALSSRITSRARRT